MASPLQPEQLQISQTFSIVEVLPTSDRICGPLLDSLQQVNALFVLGAQELYAAPHNVISVLEKFKQYLVVQDI